MKRKIERFVPVFALLLVLAGVSSLPAQAKMDYAQFQNQLQARLDQLCKTGKFPGVTLGVVLPNGRRVSLVSGYADMETKNPMPVTARIFAGSIGKTYVAAVALQLVKEGKFSLNDKISRFFKDEKWFSRLPNANDITVNMIMNHTGGLPRFVMKDGFWKKLKKDPDYKWKPLDSLTFILDEKPVHPAGKGWAYSDTDYLLLGMIIEKVTGNTFYNELQKRVLTPLKLKDTTPAVHRKFKGMVQGYTGNNIPPLSFPGKVVVNGKLVVNPGFEWCGGGLITTSTELAVYIKELMEGRVLKKDSLELMKAPVDEKTGQPTNKPGYGLGLEVYGTPEGLTYGHRGTMLGCISITEYVPKHRFSIALQINADSFYKHFNKKKTRNDYLAFLKPVIIKYLTATGR